MTSSRRRLLLVDGTGAAYRAFYAIMNLSTKAGVPTNAVFGFIKMLKQMEQAWSPTHRCVVFDGGLPAERMAALETYKAQREEMPESLRGQLLLINEYLTAAGIAWTLMGDQEADDVIATLVAKAAGSGAEVLVATSDKDLYQLVDDHVSIVPLTKAGERMGPAEVLAKTGVAAPQTVEWLALIGDSVDNIPGVPGVGPKTASKLLQEFGSLDGLWAGLATIKSDRLREVLASSRSMVERNLGLMRLRRDLPCEPDWLAYEAREPDPARVLPFFDKMEFNGLARELRERSSQLF
jgi:DNA polymerase-1